MKKLCVKIRLPYWLWLLMIVLTSAWLAGCTDNATPEPPPLLVPTRPGDQAPTLAATAPAAAGGGEGEPAATVTLAGEVTPTLAPTVTPRPAVVATPATDPLVQAVTSAPLPPTTRDLLFIADGAFKRWGRRDRRVETLVAGPDPATRVPSAAKPHNEFVGDVTAFSVSEDGKRAVVARLTGIETMTYTVSVDAGAAQEIPLERQTHELLFLDLVSGEQWRIVPQIANLRFVALSPDAQRVVFVSGSLEGAAEPTAEGTWPQSVYVLITGGGSNPSAPARIYACERDCSPPEWHVESNLVVFADPAALWLYNVAAGEPEVLLENQSEPPDVTIYSPRAWANNGRFLLMFKSAFEGGSQAVLDVPTGRIIDIPDSFVYVDPFPLEITWMPDDRLYILRTGDTLTPAAELWRLLFDDNRIVKEESLVLTNARAGAMGQRYLEDGRFAYGLVSENGGVAGLYHLTSLSQQPERVNAVPPGAPDLTSRVERITWSADGSAAIVIYNGNPYYGPAEGEFLYAMAAVFGADAHAFHWQPEIILPE